MIMKNLGLIAKILFCLPLVGFGFGHLSNANAMAGLVPSYVPGGVIWVYITGLALLLAAVSILWGKMVKLSTLLLGIMLLLFALMLHLPGMSNPDAMASQMSMASMLKDLGLAGAAFMMSANAKD